MSLCRWSSMDGMCHLYVYETDGGYSINVASNKRVYHSALPPTVPFSDPGWLERYKAVKALPHRITPIGLPYDGQSFSCDTEEEAIEVLTMLQEVGYDAPYKDLFDFLKG